MKRVLLMMVCVALTALCACTQPDEPEPAAPPSSVQTAFQTVAPTPTPEPVPPTPSPAPGPGEASLLSGVPFSEFTNDMNRNYTPVAVMIENSAAARPQYGLQLANIVYEAPVESSITRFMAVFNDVLPQKVEPVRSARIYFIKMQQQFDCIFVHYGGPSDSGYDSYIYDSDSEHIKIRVDGIKGTWSNYFVRDKARKTPHNVISDLTQIVQLYDYQPEPVPFRYSYDDGNTYDGQVISEISLPFLGDDDYVSYRYDPATNLLTRYMAGKPFISAETGEGLTLQNLIVQHVKLPRVNELAGRRIINVLGSGEAEYVIDGVFLKGTWQRGSYEDSTKYFDGNGEELVLTPGSTWIALHPDTEEVLVAY